VTIPIPPRREDVVDVTIDRVSNSGNLIARRDSNWHIRKRQIKGRWPTPGEKWKARIIQDDHSTVTPLDPLKFLSIIENYEPLKHTGGRRRKTDIALENWVQKDGIKVTFFQDESESRIVKDHSDDGAVGSKNSLLRGNKR
jgi:hypothetical protein